jgi:hypothetical protein
VARRRVGAADEADCALFALKFHLSKCTVLTIEAVFVVLVWPLCSVAREPNDFATTRAPQGALAAPIVPRQRCKPHPPAASRPRLPRYALSASRRRCGASASSSTSACFLRTPWLYTSSAIAPMAMAQRRWIRRPRHPPAVRDKDGGGSDSATNPIVYRYDPRRQPGLQARLGALLSHAHLNAIVRQQNRAGMPRHRTSRFSGTYRSALARSTCPIRTIPPRAQGSLERASRRAAPRPRAR